MANIYQIRIFLASPSDVASERRIVQKVVNDINKTIAKDQNMIVEILSSERALPEYGVRGQASINRQIGNMKNIDLFIGILATRIGTKTPKAVSGTIEEFNRAKKHNAKLGYPDIWIFFKEISDQIINNSDEYQIRELEKFKKSIQPKSLIKYYQNNKNFEDQLREWLSNWILKYKRKRKSRFANLRKSGQRNIIESNKKKWFMIDYNFFQFESINYDDIIEIRLELKDNDKVDLLKSYKDKKVSLCYSSYAGFVEFQSISIQEIKDRFIILIKVKPLRSNNSRFTRDITYRFANGVQLQPMEMANIQIKQSLFGEENPYLSEISKPTITMPNGYPDNSIVTPIVPRLWEKLGFKSLNFIPKLYLYIKYYLIMSGIIDDISKLDIKLTKKGNQNFIKIEIKARRNLYTNRIDELDINENYLLV
ncbi:hypothetical protein ACP8Y2_04525 [Herpetosiphon llansteffanensis]